jgi:hypothetical protein
LVGEEFTGDRSCTATPNDLKRAAPTRFYLPTVGAVSSSDFQVNQLQNSSRLITGCDLQNYKMTQ